MSRLPPLIHTITSLLAILAAYLWLQTTTLTTYSLQAFSGAILIYFILKRLSRSRLHHIAPTPHSLEMPLMTFSLLLLIGSTDNLTSPLFFLTYLHLLFLVLSTYSVTTITTTLGIILFHLSLTPQMTISNWNNLLTIPILLILFMFSKHQHDELVKTHIQQQQEHRATKLLELDVQRRARALDYARQAQQQEQTELVTLESFLDSFLKPKLEYMTELAKDAESYLVIKAQVDLLNSRVTDLLSTIKPTTKADPNKSTDQSTKPTHEN